MRRCCAQTHRCSARSVTPAGRPAAAKHGPGLQQTIMGLYEGTGMLFIQEHTLPVGCARQRTRTALSAPQATDPRKPLLNAGTGCATVTWVHRGSMDQSLHHLPLEGQTCSRELRTAAIASGRPVRWVCHRCGAGGQPPPVPTYDSPLCHLKTTPASVAIIFIVRGRVWASRMIDLALTHSLNAAINIL